MKTRYKRAKLLQYAGRVWNITEGFRRRNDAAIPQPAISLSNGRADPPLRLRSDGSSIRLAEKLEEHGMTQLGENHDITLDVSRRIYEAAR